MLKLIVPCDIPSFLSSAHDTQMLSCQVLPGKATRRLPQSVWFEHRVLEDVSAENVPLGQTSHSVFLCSSPVDKMLNVYNQHFDQNIVLNRSSYFRYQLFWLQIQACIWCACCRSIGASSILVYTDILDSA